LAKKKKKKRRLRRPYRILRGIYITIVVLAIIVVVGYGVYKVAFPAPTIPTVETDADTQQTQEVVPGMTSGDHQRRDQTYTFLLTCPDQASGNADSIMVVTYDVPNQKVGMLSIPRDTLVKKKNPKINSSLAGGIDNLVDVVSDLVGFPIDFYIELNLDAFVELVDEVGGVDFDVPVEMYYNDPEQDLNIFYQPGMQHLTGQQALEVCRFRHNADGTGYPLGDVQRAETARNMMITVAQKLMSNVSKVNRFVSIINENTETNLTLSDLAWFAGKAINLNLSTGVSGNGLPGDGNVSYNGTKYCYELYPEESLAMINELVNPYTTDLTLDDVNIFQAP
jgi:LCP family protein required for cell wall assembly